MFDGIIFDVDGTIWDSTPVVENAWKQAFLDNGIDADRVSADRLKGLFGLPMDDIIDDLLPDYDEKFRREFGPKCFEYEDEFLRKQSGITYPKLEETLEKLSKKYKLCIVSNCQAGYIELLFEKTGIGKYFTDHCCPGDTGMLKADNIKYISEKNGFKNPVYVGDTQMDANACKEAGVPIIFAAYGFGKVEEPDFVVRSFEELLDIL